MSATSILDNSKGSTKTGQDLYRRLLIIHSQRPLMRKRTIREQDNSSAYCPKETIRSKIGAKDRDPDLFTPYVLKLRKPARFALGCAK